MRVTTGAEARIIHEFYEAMTDVVTTTDLERHVIVSVLIKIVALLALSEDWPKDELLEAFAYTYDMEKFLNPTSRERH